MELKLDESISSPQDLKAMILEIRDYARWYAHESVKVQRKAGATSPQPAVSPATATLVRSWGAKTPISQKSLDELIAALEKFHDSAPRLTITLAAPPSGGLKKTLVTWCRQNVAPNVLITFRFNATLLGGMVVRSGSKIFDWSFRRQILANRARFPEVLRRV